MKKYYYHILVSLALTCTLLTQVFPQKVTFELTSPEGKKYSISMNFDKEKLKKNPDLEYFHKLFFANFKESKELEKKGKIAITEILPQEVAKKLFSGIGTIYNLHAKYEAQKAIDSENEPQYRHAYQGQARESLRQVAGLVPSEHFVPFYLFIGKLDIKSWIRPASTVLADSFGLEDLKGFVDQVPIPASTKKELTKEIINKFPLSEIQAIGGFAFPLTTLAETKNAVLDKMLERMAPHQLQIEAPQANRYKLSDLEGLANYLKQRDGQNTLMEIKNINIAPNHEIDDLSEFTKFPNIEFLSASEQKLRSIKPLENLPRLTYLMLGMNKIENVDPLAGLKDLKNLDLIANQVENIDKLGGLRKLERFDIRKNKIHDISVIENYPKLKLFQADYNKIRFIPSMEKLSSIEELYLNSNKITVLTPLKGLRLKTLEIADNPIQQGLDVLPEIIKNLTRLSIDGKFVQNNDTIRDAIGKNPNLQIFTILTTNQYLPDQIGDYTRNPWMLMTKDNTTSLQQVPSDPNVLFYAYYRREQ